jgi:hypothetical protein
MESYWYPAHMFIPTSLRGYTYKPSFLWQIREVNEVSMVDQTESHEM